MYKIIASATAGIVLFSSLGIGMAPVANAQEAAPAQEVAPAAAGDGINRTYQQQIIDTFNGINTFRANKGLAPVKFNATVSEIAEDWSEKQIQDGTFIHNPDFSTDPRVSGRWTHAAEIIAARSDTSAEGLVFQWENSPSHNAVMSDPNLKTMGVGIAVGTRNGAPWMFGTVNFFDFTNNPPAGQYNSAQDFFDGLPPLQEGEVKDVTPASPTFNSSTGYYTIPTSEGVKYYRGGRIQEPGTYFSGWETITIDAVAQTGYRIAGTSKWTHSFANKITVTPPAPTFNTNTSYYTIPSAEGVYYTVNGLHTHPGTWSDGWITVTVKALPTYGYTLSGTTEWTVTFKKPVVSVVPTAPTFNTTAGTYTIPTKTGVQYFSSGSPVSAGTYDSGWVTVQVEARPVSGYSLSGTTMWTQDFIKPIVVNNPSIKTKGDLVAADGYGNLWNYGLMNSSRVRLGGGWHVMQDINVADWNADGIQDIIAIHKDGTLYIYLGKAQGGFDRIRIGAGWGPYSIEVTKWKSGDKYPSIIARHPSTGKLFHYPRSSATGLASRTLLGNGWGRINIYAMDYDKDGRQDVVARFANGDMKLYRTDGNGRFINEYRKVVGRGWAGFTSLDTIDGFKGASTPGLLARDRYGALYYYGTGTNKWIPRVKIGNGWQTYNIAGH